MLVRLRNAVKSDNPIYDLPYDELVAEPGVYEAQTNPQGAVSVVLSNGQTLGLRPREFEWIANPPEPHMSEATPW